MNAARRNTSRQSTHSLSAMAAVSSLRSLNTGGMCSIGKSINERSVTDGTHEVTPNNEHEGQSDFR